MVLEVHVESCRGNTHTHQAPIGKGAEDILIRLSMQMANSVYCVEYWVVYEIYL